MDILGLMILCLVWFILGVYFGTLWLGNKLEKLISEYEKSHPKR